MCDKTDFEICRLCLNSGELLLINVFDEDTNLEFMLQKTIEDLIDVKVVEEPGYPWLVCSNCMEKLTIFRLFKRRCAECLFVFYHRIQKGCNPRTEDWLTDGEKVFKEEKGDVAEHDSGDVEGPGDDLISIPTSDKMWVLSSPTEVVDHSVQLAPVVVEGPEGTWMIAMAPSDANELEIQFPGVVLKEEIGDDSIAIETLDGSTVEVGDDVIPVKAENETANGILPVSSENDIDSSVVTSMREGVSRLSDNEEAGNMEGRDVQCHGLNGMEGPEGDPVHGTPCSVWALSSPGESSAHSVQMVPVLVGDTYSLNDRLNQMADNSFNAVEIQIRGELKDEFVDETITSDVIDRRDIDVRDDMIHVKEEADFANGCSVAPEKDVDSSMVTSMQNVGSRWSNNEEAMNLDSAEGVQLFMSFNGEAYVKEYCEVGIPQEEGCLGGEVSAGQDGGGVGQGRDVGSLPHTCLICGDMFAQGEELEAHMIHVHLVKKFQRTGDACSERLRCQSELDGLAKSARGGTRKLKCPQSHGDFKCPYDVGIQLMANVDDKPYKCDVCGRGFALKANVKRHLLTHAERKPYHCRLCSKSFINGLYFKKHMMTHSCESQFNCDVCGKGFHSKYLLGYHMLRHVAPGGNKCQLCSKGYVKKGKHRGQPDHTLSHPSHRPFRCDVCSKCFARKDHVLSHMQVHFGEKPFKCDRCSKCFRDKRTMEGHMMTHTGHRPQKCQLCSKEFVHRRSLLRHLKLHSKQGKEN